MKYLGDIPASQTLYFAFTTIDATGAPIVLAGSPIISVYKAGNLTQVTTGVTLTVSYDSVVGLNHVAIATSDAFYAAGNDYMVVITTGTVGGISVVGYVVATFSIENRSEELSANAVDNILDEVINESAHTTANSFGLLVRKIAYILGHTKLKVTDSTGAIAVRNAADNADSWTGSITDDSTTTVRTALT